MKNKLPNSQLSVLIAPFRAQLDIKTIKEAIERRVDINSLDARYITYFTLQLLRSRYPSRGRRFL